jgi:lactoylglutathione lyase
MKHKSILLLISVLLIGSSAFAQSKLPMRINHLAIYVKDIKQSRVFYTQVIGLDSIPEPFHDGLHLWLNMGGGASIHVIGGAPERKQYFLNNHLCLSTTNVEDFKKILEKRGIVWYNAAGEKGKTTTRVDGVQQIWLQDPDGYWLEINDAKN